MLALIKFQQTSVLDSSDLCLLLFLWANSSEKWLFLMFFKLRLKNSKLFKIDSKRCESELRKHTLKKIPDNRFLFLQPLIYFPRLSSKC